MYKVRKTKMWRKYTKFEKTKMWRKYTKFEKTKMWLKYTKIRIFIHMAIFPKMLDDSKMLKWTKLHLSSYTLDINLKSFYFSTIFFTPQGHSPGNQTS